MYSEVYFDSSANRLKVVRAALDISQLQLAKLIDSSLSTIYRWENSYPNLNTNHKDRLRHVGILPEWIDYGTGQPFKLEIKKVRNNILTIIKD